jgi:hypothetical protein
MIEEIQLKRLLLMATALQEALLREMFLRSQPVGLEVMRQQQTVIKKSLKVLKDYTLMVDQLYIRLPGEILEDASTRKKLPSAYWMSMQKHADMARASTSTADFRELTIIGLACAKKS